MSWRNPPHVPGRWAGPTVGTADMPAADFIVAVKAFSSKVLSTMNERVGELERAGPPPGIALDVPALRAEHQLRIGLADIALARTPDTDWTAVREGAALITQAGETASRPTD